MSSPFLNERYNQDKPWYDQAEDFATGYFLKAPYDKIFIGCDPGDGLTKAAADSFDAIVNVSSTRCATFEPSRPDQRTYWFPIIEMGRWPIVYLLWLKEVLDHHYTKGHRVYLHCHAGAYRSPSAALLWLDSRGLSKEEALKICNERSPFIYDIQKDHGNIPKLKDALFEQFRQAEKEIQEKGYGTLCIESIMTHKLFDPWDHEVISGSSRMHHLIHHYFWFYFKPKYWLKDKWGTFKDWAISKNGYIGERGRGSHHYPRKYFFAFPKFAEPKNILKVGSWSFIPNQGWIQNSKWDSKLKTHIDLIERCPDCDGRGVLIDETKPFGTGHSRCEKCLTTGVKLPINAQGKHDA